MAGLRKDCVYLGIKGHVVAIDSGTGKELWRTKLKGGDLVTVGQDGTRVYGATKGELYGQQRHRGRRQATAGAPGPGGDGGDLTCDSLLQRY